MKGYVIATIRVDDAEAYEAYRSRTGAVIESFGGRFLVRGGRVEPREGGMERDRVVVLEFPTMEQARAFYDSDAYQAILPIRQANADSHLFLVEGVADA
jgi:uncharacterized protein (DUF1330 family)